MQQHKLTGILIAALLFTGMANAQTNYIRTWEAAAPMTSPGQLLTRPLRDVRQTTQYGDGLGRPMQTVVKQGSQVTGQPAKDVVSPVVYDDAGRESVKYLPYAATDATGLFKTNLFAQQKSFYDAQLAGQGESFYYAQTVYEPSPLNRVEKTMAPGINWAGAGKGVEMKYRLNTAIDEVRVWDVTDNADNFGHCSSTRIYPAAELLKNITIDENQKQVIEFKDKQGQVILKKVQLTATSDDGTGKNHDGWLCTYYIYDDFGNLCCVIQPEGVKALLSNGWQLTTAILDEQCFRYEYDEYHRMTMKKVPGAGEVYMVYDQRDRLVMTQDANLRIQGKWLITVYENNFNRPVQTGLLTSSTAFAQHRANAKNAADYPAISGWEMLTKAHYDNYSNLPAGLTSNIAAYTTNGFITNYNAAPDYAQEIKKSDLTFAMATWSQAKILGSNPAQYINSVSIYDDKGRVIQVQSYDEATTTVTVVTTQYSWSGKPLHSLLTLDKKGTNAQVTETLTSYSYDDLGRITDIKKRISQTGKTTVEKVIAKNEYDALGQLKKKTLNAEEEIETMTYDYNIRGWLLGANRDFAKTTAAGTNYFGFDLGYDKTNLGSIGGYGLAQLNGNIGGTVWKSAGDKEIRKYDFDYDAVNRLTAADFSQYTSNAFNKTAGIDFSVSGLNYDANGNMLNMAQNGYKGAASTTIDNLSYSYFSGSNKLRTVTDGNNDNSSTLGDFKYDPALNKADADYAYDVNGNLTSDRNKSITNIVYNHLNLPQQITIAGKGTIEYVYDATGNKLKKIVRETGKPDKTTLYLGGAVYENDTLQFIAHEEGRMRPTGTNRDQLATDYFLKDHLGNVRMVLTDENKKNIYPAATLEEGAVATENSYYKINTGSIVTNPISLPYTYQNNNSIPNPAGDPNGTSAKMYRINGNEENKIGLGITLKVMSGDTINVLGKTFYSDRNTGQQNNSIPIANIIAGLIGGVAGGVPGGKATIDAIESAARPPIEALLGSQSIANQATPTKPKAYINCLFFDEQFKYVENRYSQVGDNNEIKTHTLEGIIVPKNGYLHVYASNESPVPVFFDNLQVTHARGRILEENHYYPFGLTMAGISSKAQTFGKPDNHYKYNGIEQIGDLDLGDYDAKFRELDPQIGRWWQIDPKIDSMETWSPYVLNYNNPLRFNDPLGDVPGPGDQFKSVVQAAKDFGQTYNGNSIVEKREYGATIYKTVDKNGNTYYSYSIPNAASGASVQVSDAPDGTRPVATIHSHGNSWGIDVSESDNNFSGVDQWNNINRKMDGYLTTPDGSLKKHNYKTYEQSTISTDLPSDPNDATRKNAQNAMMFYHSPAPKVDLRQSQLMMLLFSYLNFSLK